MLRALPPQCPRLSARKADDDCRQELRWLYDRRNLKEAEQDLQAWLMRWATRYPKLTDWVEAHIGETLNFYSLPRQHHKHLKSTNMLERLNEEIKRRTRWSGSFPTRRVAYVWSEPSVPKPTRAGSRIIAT